jgi:hypothetical protein
MDPPRDRAPRIIEGCAHPSFRDQLRDYFDRALAARPNARHTRHLRVGRGLLRRSDGWGGNLQIGEHASRGEVALMPRQPLVRNSAHSAPAYSTRGAPRVLTSTTRTEASRVHLTIADSPVWSRRAGTTRASLSRSLHHLTPSGTSGEFNCLAMNLKEFRPAQTVSCCLRSTPVVHT